MRGRTAVSLRAIRDPKLRGRTSPWTSPKLTSPRTSLATHSPRTRRDIVDLRGTDTSLFRNILARRSPAARYHDASATEIPSMLTPPDTHAREHSPQPETCWWRGYVVSGFSCLSGRAIGLRNRGLRSCTVVDVCSRCVACWSRKADTEPGPRSGRMPAPSAETVFGGSGTLAGSGPSTCFCIRGAVHFPGRVAHAPPASEEGVDGSPGARVRHF